MQCRRVAGGGSGRQSDRTIATTFGVNWSHLGAQIVSFGIVCAVLYAFAYKPILQMLEARRQQIASGLANAEKIKAELARIEAERQQILMKADDEGKRLIDEARAAAARVQAEETQKAIAAAEQIVVRAREATERDRVQHARRAQARSRPVGRADDGEGDRQGVDGGRSPSVGRGNGAAARTVGRRHENDETSQARRSTALPAVPRQRRRWMRAGSGGSWNCSPSPDVVGTLPCSADVQRRVRLDRDRHAALVESAEPLPRELRESIQADLDADCTARAWKRHSSRTPPSSAECASRSGATSMTAACARRLAALEARL